jgi:hypothetical protein
VAAGLLCAAPNAAPIAVVDRKSRLFISEHAITLEVGRAGPKLEVEHLLVGPVPPSP